MMGTATAAASSESLSPDESESEYFLGGVSLHAEVSLVWPLRGVPNLPKAHATHSVDELLDQLPAGQISLTEGEAQNDPAAHSLADDEPIGQY